MTASTEPDAAKCLAAFEAALARADLDAAMALLSDDVLFFYSNGSAHLGKSAVRAAIKANFDSIIDDTYATHDHVWFAQSGTAAACTFRFAWTGTMDGKPVSGTRARYDGIAARSGWLAYRT